MHEFLEEALMRHGIEGLGKVQDCDVNLLLGVESFHDVVDGSD